jgi:hypothetical protein
MEDNQVATSQAAPAEQPQANADLAQMMAIALGDNAPSQEQQVSAPSVTEIAPIAEAPVFSFETLKEKFNYEKPEDVVSEIEQLRALRNAPPQVEEQRFENEKSKKLYEAFKAGRQKEILTILAEEERLETLTTQEVTLENAADIIKMGMQLKYKDLTPKEIEYKYNKTYPTPKEPSQRTDELDEDFEFRKEQWKEQVADIQMSAIIDAKLAKPELDAQKTKIVLPDIKENIDEDYISYKQGLEQQSKAVEEAIKEYKSFTPDALGTTIPFKDEANKIDFSFDRKPTSEEFADTIDMVSDINKFYQKFIGSDGKADRKAFAKAVHFGIHGENIVMEAIKQAKNATLKSMLPDNSGGNRYDVVAGEPSELEIQMQRALN